MNKIIRIGHAADGDVFCRIEFTHGKLSITGVIGPQASGNCKGSCKGSCGQIDSTLRKEQATITLASGWSKGMLTRFLQVWSTRHLNDLQAGSPAQREELTKHKFPGYPIDHYTWAKETLAAAGLQPDPTYLHNDKPYSYGSAGLRVEVPADVIAFLESLPDTDKTPAWV